MVRGGKRRGQTSRASSTAQDIVNGHDIAVFGDVEHLRGEVVERVADVHLVSQKLLELGILPVMWEER